MNAVRTVDEKPVAGWALKRCLTNEEQEKWVDAETDFDRVATLAQALGRQQDEIEQLTNNATHWHRCFDRSLDRQTELQASLDDAKHGIELSDSETAGRDQEIERLRQTVAAMEVERESPRLASWAERTILELAADENHRQELQAEIE